MSEESPGAAILLDTENVLRAFGYELESEREERERRVGAATPRESWDRRRTGDARGLSMLFPLSRSPEGARTHGVEVLRSLVSWAADRAAAPAKVREGYGKEWDGAVLRLRAHEAFERTGFVHYAVADGKNKADDALLARLGELARDSLTDGAPLYPFIAVGSGDKKDVWSGLAAVATREKRGVRFVIVIPPDEFPRGHRPLYGGEDHPRKGSNVSHAYLHIIHMTETMRRKRSGTVERAAAEESPDQVPASASTVTVAGLACRMVDELPRPSRNDMAFGPGGWHGASQGLLVAAGLDPEEAKSALQDFYALEEWLGLTHAHVTAWLPSQWRTFAYAALDLPSALSTWPPAPASGDEERRRLMDVAEARRLACVNRAADDA